jgi:hypothetical protein
VKSFPARFSSSEEPRLALKWNWPTRQTRRFRLDPQGSRRALERIDIRIGIFPMGDLESYPLQKRDQFTSFVIALCLNALSVEVLRCVADTVRHGTRGVKTSSEEGIVY